MFMWRNIFDISKIVLVVVILQHENLVCQVRRPNLLHSEMKKDYIHPLHLVATEFVFWTFLCMQLLSKTSFFSNFLNIQIRAPLDSKIVF